MAAGALAAAYAGGALARARRRGGPRGGLEVVARRISGQQLAFEKLYKPLGPEGEGKEFEQESKWKKPLRKAAPWRKENAELREDPTYAKQWVWDPSRRGSKRRRFAKGVVMDRVQELDDRASELRAKYKRPRFGWKEVMQDDLRTTRLSEDLPAIGTGEVWLNKFLSHAGACSRRKVAELVLQGRVQINGEVVQDICTKVDPKKDKVFLDGRRKELKTLGEIIWIMLNKPKGVISTFEDSEGRKTVMDLVPFAKKRRLIPVGRIDRNAAGLLLLTNDYEWQTIMIHPRYEHTKRYKVEIYNGLPSRVKMQALRNGLELPDEPRPLLPLEDFEVMQQNKTDEIATIKFTLKEGKYRQIRRMFEYIGHPVKSIKRTEFGLLQLDRSLKAGEWRMLTPKEIRRLKGPTILKRPMKHPLDRQREIEREMDGHEAEQPVRQRAPREQRAQRAWRRERQPSSVGAYDGGRPGDQWGSRGQRRRGGSRQDLDDEGLEEEDWQEDMSRTSRRREGRSRGGYEDDEDFTGHAGRPRAERRGGRRRGAFDDSGDWERAEGRRGKPAAREASAEDLSALQQRFNQLSAVSSGPAPALEKDWERSWVEQLDAMQAEKAAPPESTHKERVPQSGGAY